MFDIVLHLGAHKTATTFVQKTLHKNREMLVQQGILAPPLKGFRDVVSAKFGRRIAARTTKISLMDVLRGEFADAEIDQSKTVVLSDKNIIGYSGLIFSKGTFYGTIPKRCKVFNKWLGQDPAKIVFSIRPYPGFFISAYSQWIGPSRSVLTRDEAKSRVLGLKRGWPDVVRDIRKMYPHSELVVTEYRRRPLFIASQFEFLVGDAAADLAYNHKYFWNKSLSPDKLAELEQLVSLGQADKDTEKALRAQKMWGRPEQHLEFWSAEEKEQLLMRYKADKSEIANMAEVDRFRS